MAITIEQADRQDRNEARYWENERNYRSPLGLKCAELRQQPIDSLDAEDLRFLIGQNVGTRHLLPMTMALLRQNPRLCAGRYPGDLLLAALALPDAYWAANPPHVAPMHEVAVLGLAAVAAHCVAVRQEHLRLYGATVEEKDLDLKIEREVRRLAADFVRRY